MKPLRSGAGDAPLCAASVLTAAGVLLSGPLGIALVMLVHPQPDWRDAETFIGNYHPVQSIPYLFGLLLVVGLLLFVARSAARVPAARRHRAYAALMLAAAFASMIFINYSLQIVYLPWLVRHHDPALSHITMANPGSLGWAFEMVGYGVAGGAGWLVSPGFPGPGRMRTIRLLLIANGIVSIAGAIITAIDLAWVQTPAGLTAFAAWNLLLFATMILAAVEARKPSGC